MSTEIAAEVRAEWRAEATRVRLGSCCFDAGKPGHGPGEHRAWYDDRILALLDALNREERDHAFAKAGYARATASLERAEAALARVEALAEKADESRLMCASDPDCPCSYKDCYECGKWHNCTHNPWASIRAALAGPSPTDEPRKRWLSDREYVIDNPSPTDKGGEGA